MSKRKRQTGYMRYILRTPTEIYGHYTSKYFSKLSEAKEKLVPGGHVIDILANDGWLGSRIVASTPERNY